MGRFYFDCWICGGPCKSVAADCAVPPAVSPKRKPGEPWDYERDAWRCPRCGGCREDPEHIGACGACNGTGRAGEKTSGGVTSTSNPFVGARNGTPVRSGNVTTSRAAEGSKSRAPNAPVAQRGDHVPAGRGEPCPH